MLERTWGKGNPSALLVKMLTGRAIMKKIWRFFKKLKIELPYDPGLPLLGIYLKEMKSVSQKSICTPVFIVALLTIAKIRKQFKSLSMDAWIKKDMLCVYNGILFSHEKEGNPAICNNMEKP